MAQVIWNPDIDAYDNSVIPIDIAKSIAKYLSVDDLRRFSLVSKNTYTSVKDPYLWVNKLKKMGLWKNAIEDFTKTPEKLVDMETPLSCMDKIYRIPKMARKQVLMIHKHLKRYYEELSANVPDDRLSIFKDFQTPEEQAKILGNLRRYNKIDSRIENRLSIQDKLNALFEIFENALLRELEISFDSRDYNKTRRFVQILVSLHNEQTLMDFYLQKTLLDNDQGFKINQTSLEEFFCEKVAKDESRLNEGPKFTLNTEAIQKFIENIANELNNHSEIIDSIFTENVPIMYKVCEEMSTNLLTQFLLSVIEISKTRNLYFELVPYIYKQFTEDLIKKLKPNNNIGSTYKKIVRELFDMSFESFIAEFIHDEIIQFRSFSSEQVNKWNDQILQKEEETTKNILKHVKVEEKNDFLTSFKKIFTINGNGRSDAKDEEQETYSTIEAKAKILIENIKSLTNVLNVELVILIVNQAKLAFKRLLTFREFTIASLRKEVIGHTQEVFRLVIEATGNDHLKPGFEKALVYLKNYAPSETQRLSLNSNSCIEPLVLFCEVINMADMILQMIDIFYKEEILNTHVVKHENSILNPALQSKKKLEAMVDTYVADGLMSGIDILMTEIEQTYDFYRKDSDYDMDDTDKVVSVGPTEAATKVIRILEDNIDLLVGCTDNSVVEVFQQEIAERFFQLLVKSLKKSTISVTGAINLIADLNSYYDFILKHIRSNKRYIIPLYQALKKVGNIYLIGTDDSKAIGKLVNDLSKFNGIFGQEEIYEFVQRRKDWIIIKRDVEKVMYGLSLGDCNII